MNFLKKWIDIKSDSDTYDTVFLGSSRGYCAYNPLIFDVNSSTTSYNMCTGNQDIIQSYYILKEILKHQHPKYIIYDLFLPSFPSRTDFHSVFFNALFMSVSGKLDLTWNGYGLHGI